MDSDSNYSDDMKFLEERKAFYKKLNMNRSQAEIDDERKHFIHIYGKEYGIVPNNPNEITAYDKIRWTLQPYYRSAMRVLFAPLRYLYFKSV